MFTLLMILAVGAEEKPVLVLDARGHTARVNRVLFTPDGRELITVSDDKTIRCWDATTGEPLRALRPPIGPGPEGMIYAAALSPDGKRLAVGGYLKDNEIYLVSLPNSRIERRLIGHTNVILDLAFSADGRRLISGSVDDTARIWDVSSGKCLHILKGHTEDIYGVTFSPDGRYAATASRDDTARIWRLSATSASSAVTLRSHTDNVRCIAWSPDGKTIATGSDDQSIRLWTPSGTLRETFDTYADQITSLTFTPDSQSLLVTTDWDCSILDSTSGRERVWFEPHTNSVRHGSLFTAENAKGAERRTMAATTGGNDSETFVWNASDGAVLHRLASQGRTTWSAAWSGDGKMIAWGHNAKGAAANAERTLERTFHLADLTLLPDSKSQISDSDYRRAQATRGSTTLAATDHNTLNVRRGNRTITTITLSKTYGQVRCFTLLPGDRAAVGANFGLYLYDTRTGKQLREFQGHTGVVWAVAPSLDDRWLLSACMDQTLRIWDPDRDEPVLSLFFAGDQWIAWTPEGYYAASPAGEKLMGWHVNQGPDQFAQFHPASAFRKTLYRPDVIARLLETGSLDRAIEVADRERGRKTERTEAANILPPLVTITTPAAGAKLDAADITVTATARSPGGQPISMMKLLVNGRPFQARAGERTFDPPQTQPSATWTVPLELGRSRLQVLADSTGSQGASDEIHVNYAGATRPDYQDELPRLYVLAVGISKYQNQKLQLNFAARDASVIKDSFEQYTKPLYRSIEVRLLTDQQATANDIRKGVSWLRSQVTQRDVGVFFFSGHGEKDTDGTLYFLPVEVDVSDLFSTAVPADVLTRGLSGCPGKVMVMLDACHSGGIGGLGRKKGGLTDDLVRDLVREETGMVVMCSSTGSESSLENNELRLGTFTAAIVEGMAARRLDNKQKANVQRGTDGAIYLHHLDAYVTDRVKELTGGKQRPVTDKPSTISSFPLSKPE